MLNQNVKNLTVIVFREFGVAKYIKAIEKAIYPVLRKSFGIQFFTDTAWQHVRGMVLHSSDISGGAFMVLPIGGGSQAQVVRDHGHARALKSQFLSVL